MACPSFWNRPFCVGREGPRRGSHTTLFNNRRVPQQREPNEEIIEKNQGYNHSTIEGGVACLLACHFKRGPFPTRNLPH